MKTKSALRDIVALSKKFISIESTRQNAQAREKVLELALSSLKGFTIERFERNGVKSALIYNSKKRPKKFKIILNGHLDVVPAKKDQFVPQVKANRLYGMGSMDMKGSVACLITAFKQVANTVHYPLGLQLVTDEEVGGFDGTKYQVEKGVRTEFIIAGESTNLDIVYKAKGVLWLTVSASGKTAHGAYPWRGENAISKINEFLNVLKKRYPIPKKQQWITTVNISSIATTNQTFNKIPDNCIVWLDVRYVPEEAGSIFNTIRALVPKKCTVETIMKEPPVYTASHNQYFKALQKAAKTVMKKDIVLRGAQGSSDARHFAPVGSAGIEFGPAGGEIGSDNEWVDIQSLEKYQRILTSFLLSLN